MWRKVEISLFIIAIIGWLMCCPAIVSWYSSSNNGTVNVEVYFSPKGGCTAAAVKEIDKAKKSIKVQAYSFTSIPIAKALVDAHKRGVDVKVVLDRGQRGEKATVSRSLIDNGIVVLFDEKHAIAHNKIILIDNKVLITGSFNFSKAAEESNAENMLVFDGLSPSLESKYSENFEKHFSHSVSAK